MTDDETIRLRLWIAEGAPNSTLALGTLRSLIDAAPRANEIEMEIKNVFDEPDLAARDGALVTPMLVVLNPPPCRQFAGTLKNRTDLAELLGLSLETE